MSASTIARWNAISMERDEEGETSKRSRPQDEQSDDDVSLVSRSPSPDLDRMDVENGSIYHRRQPSPEVITVETRIKPENKGFALLAKMGWTEGMPLGLSQDGRVDPIPFQLKNDSTGIGKITQDVRMVETTVAQRRNLDSERQRKETEDQRRAREDIAARKAALQNEISATLRPFYCELCDKQFQNVSQYDEHTNSYAHHHKVRLRDMQLNARPTPKDELEKRKEKERRREEKELRKIAAAAGIKMPKPPVLPSGVSSSLAPSLAAPLPNPEGKSGFQPISSGEPKKGGWATVSTPAAQSSGFKKSGWAAVGPSSTISDPRPSSSSGSSVSNSSQAPPIPPPPALPSTSHLLSPTSTPQAPTFRNAGWTALETTVSRPSPSSQSSPPVQLATVSDSHVGTSALPPPQQPTATPAKPAGTGWKQFQSSLKGQNRR